MNIGLNFDFSLHDRYYYFFLHIQTIVAENNFKKLLHKKKHIKAHILQAKRIPSL